MNVSRRQCLALLSAGFSGAAMAPGAARALVGRWREVASRTDGVVGVAALHLSSGDRVSLRGDERFPLASVCKVPIALNILAMVDEGKWRLDDLIDIQAQDVWTGVSDIAERWPERKRYSVDELLARMVARSDNTAVETLWRVGGGFPAMTLRFRQWRLHGIRIDRSERECALNASGVQRIPSVEQWTPGMVDELAAQIPPESRLAAMRRFLADRRDTATPDATVKLLKGLYRGDLLSRSSTARLIQIMEGTSTGRARLRGLLPPGTIVAHKSGTTASPQGLNGATNDVGVVTLPRD